MRTSDAWVQTSAWGIQRDIDWHNGFLDRNVLENIVPMAYNLV
jgi:hypothetical protein